MPLEQKCGVVETLGERQKFSSKLERSACARSVRCHQPYPPQRLEPLDRRADLVSELPGTRIVLLDLRRGVASRCLEGRPEGKSQGQLLAVSRRARGELSEKVQRLREVGERIGVGRVRECLHPGLAEVSHRLVSELAARGVVREPFHL